MKLGPEGFMQRWRAEAGFMFPLLCLLSGIFVLLRGSISHLLAIEWLDIDLIPIALVYLLGRDQELRAGTLAFCSGILTDILAPCQFGLFALTYSALTFGVNRCRRFLDFENRKTSSLFVAGYLVAKWAFVLAVLKLFAAGQLSPSISLVSVVVSALITGLLAMPLFYLLELAGGGRDSGTLSAVSGDTHGRTLRL
jgi:rod shape-determining protein MreD